MDELGPAWDKCLDCMQGVTLFSRWIYLRELSEIDIIVVVDRNNTVAAFPVPVVIENGVRLIARRNYLSPYFPVLFRSDNGLPVRAERRRRAALKALVSYIQREYAGMVLPLHPDLTDMAPFQWAHFQLELRNTYELPLASLGAVWKGFDPKVRNHIHKAEAISIDEDPFLSAFDFEAAVFYETKTQREHWRGLAHNLVAAGCATSLIARYQGRTVGGLFLAYDERTAYNLLSYFDRTAPSRGVPSALIWAAACLAEARGLDRLDLEGSVLPRIETFYQQFGGVRRPYFQVHWYADEVRQRPFLYYYDEEAW